MNLKTKWMSFQKRPEFIALAGTAILFALLIIYKIGVVIGHSLFEQYGN